MSNEDQLDNIRQQLEQSSQHLPDETQRRLRQIRAEAMQRATKKTTHPWLLPASGLAVAAGLGFVAISLWLTPAPELNNNAPDLLHDMELLSSNDELDFYEDLDFYLWLDAENNAS